MASVALDSNLSRIFCDRAFAFHKGILHSSISSNCFMGGVGQYSHVSTPRFIVTHTYSNPDDCSHLAEAMQLCPQARATATIQRPHRRRPGRSPELGRRQRTATTLQLFMVSRPYGPPVFVWAGPYEMAFLAFQKSKKSCSGLFSAVVGMLSGVSRVVAIHPLIHSIPQPWVHQSFGPVLALRRDEFHPQPQPI